VWPAPYQPWRPGAYAISWLFFVLWIVLGHGGVVVR
jgi:hypothetical protein